MTAKPRLVIALVLPSLAIVIFTVLTVLSMIRLDQIQSEMGIKSTQNMLWVSSRLHVAQLKLSQSLLLMAEGKLSAKELSQQLNTYIAAASVLADGPQARQVEHVGLGDDLRRMQSSMERIETLVTAAAAGDRVANDLAREQLAGFESFLALSDNRAMIAEWDEMALKLDVAGDQLHKVWRLLLAVFAAGIVVVSALLVTAQKARKRTLSLRSQRHFSEIMVNASESGIIAIDHEGAVQLWNPKAEQLFCTPAREAVGEHLVDVQHIFDAPDLARPLQACLSGEAGFATDFPLTRPGRPTEYIELRFLPLDATLAETLSGIIVIHDVSDRHETQRALAADRDQLEAEVERRTKALDAALSRERQASEVYRNFAAMVSHQFRTPLAVTDSALQRIGRLGTTQSPEAFAERVTRARGAVARLVSLVERTLATARLDAGQVEASGVPTDLDALTRELAAREDIPAARLAWEFPDHLPRAQCDPALTDMVLSNLLSNALKYAPADGMIRIIGVTIGQSVQISVANRGALSQVAAVRLFDRYYRIDASHGSSGIGLGLYMAKRLSQLQGGTLTLRQPGDGWIYFDLKLSQALPRADRADGRRQSVNA